LNQRIQNANKSLGILDADWSDSDHVKMNLAEQRNPLSELAAMSLFSLIP
jgi:hypothetical protein